MCACCFTPQPPAHQCCRDLTQQLFLSSHCAHLPTCCPAGALRPAFRTTTKVFATAMLSGATQLNRAPDPRRQAHATPLLQPASNITAACPTQCYMMHRFARSTCCGNHRGGSDVVLIWQQRHSVPHAGQCFNLAAPLMMATHMVCESMHSSVARRRSAVVGHGCPILSSPPVTSIRGSRAQCQTHRAKQCTGCPQGRRAMACARNVAALPRRAF